MEVAEMYKVIILMILLTLAVSLPAYGQNFQVRAVEEDPQQVVLRDKDTGKEWVVRAGDEIEGWAIIEVKKNRVVMRKKVPGDISHKAIVCTIPIPQCYTVVPVSGN
jgi:hypothetical protein